jgi:hypothetical protein
MPMTSHASRLPLGFGLALLLAWTPADAQAVQVAGDTTARVPYLPGSRSTETLGPPPRGSVGRPRRLGQILIQLDVLPVCTLDAGSGTEPAVQCSRGLPFLSAISSDADEAFDTTSAFAPPPIDRGLVRVNAQRLTVDY